jgi:hypothetical protein
MLGIYSYVGGVQSKVVVAESSGGLLPIVAPPVIGT